MARHRQARLEGVHLAGLQQEIGAGTVALPGRRQQPRAVVGVTTHLVAEGVGVLGVAGVGDGRARDGVEGAAGHSGTHRREGALDRREQDVEAALDLGRGDRFAFAQQVERALQIGAVALDLHPEVHVHDVAALEATLGGAVVGPGGVGAREHGRAVLLGPGGRDAQLVHPPAQERRHLGLGLARAEEAGHLVVELQRDADGLAHAAELVVGLALAQGRDDALGRDEPRRVARALEVARELAEHAVAEAVGDLAVVGEVDGEGLGRLGVEPGQQGRANRLDVGQHLGPRARVGDGRRVEAADDGGGAPAGRDQEGAGPGDVFAQDELEDGIGGDRGLPHERQPGTVPQLTKDRGRLGHLLARQHALLP